jgi:hypothetical protein
MVPGRAGRWMSGAPSASLYGPSTVPEVDLATPTHSTPLLSRAVK